MKVTNKINGTNGIVLRRTVSSVMGPKTTPMGGNCCTSGSMNLKASVNGRMYARLPKSRGPKPHSCSAQETHGGLEKTATLGAVYAKWLLSSLISI